MSAIEISAILSADGDLLLRNWSTDAEFTGERVDLTGLDGRVLRLFERWMTLRDRSWEEEEIKTFGQLLHRRLFPNDAWGWVRRQIAKPEQQTRLMLAFPSDASSSRLAALPWEFLCTQDRPGEDGRFVALLPQVTLSRVVPSGTLQKESHPLREATILPVVGDAHNPRLGTVQYEEVLAKIETIGTQPGFACLPALLETTERELAEHIADSKPDIVHYMGHGRFRDGRGALALRGTDGGTDWVSEDRLARALTSDASAPSIVVLHACEGGSADYEYKFAGLSPALVRAGAKCVIAMQYPVTNSNATLFSTELYKALAANEPLDRAVQTARRSLWRSTNDPRLVGVPTIYQGNAEPLLTRASATGD